MKERDLQMFEKKKNIEVYCEYYFYFFLALNFSTKSILHYKIVCRTTAVDLTRRIPRKS